MTKKLFEVRTEVVAYVLAEDEVEAQEVGQDAFLEEIHNMNLADVDIAEVGNARWPLAKGWTPQSLVYANGEDPPALGEAMKKLR